METYLDLNMATFKFHKYVLLLIQLKYNEMHLHYPNKVNKSNISPDLLKIFVYAQSNWYLIE